MLCSFITLLSPAVWALAMPLLGDPGHGSQETWEHGLVLLSAVFSLAPGSSLVERQWGQVTSSGLFRTNVPCGAVQSVVLILETSKNTDISLLVQNLIAKWNQDRNDF